MALNHVGVNSLLAVNSWIGLINSNLQGASRTSFKTTRISFSDGLGINSVSNNLIFPPATLSVQATSIEWGQGTIVNSTSQTHFAIQGEGFFVLHDPSSNRYFLSRDGEFHWGDGGYLVNSSGLRVVSNGQDYIRFGAGDDSDIFDPDGVSRELEHYGNKSFLLVDVGNRDNLRMSQYGSTVFELDGSLTTRVRNDFSYSADGITFVYDDPDIISVVDDPGFVYVPNPPLVPDTDFSIDFGGNGVFDFSTHSVGIPSGNGGIDFDPTIHTIQDIVDAINVYGSSAAVTALGGGNGRIIASYDDFRDLLIIENRLDSAVPGENGVTWGGVNGTALRNFFRMVNDPGASDELTTPLFQSSFVQSKQDIDNSSKASYKDVGYDGDIFTPGFQNGPLGQLALPVATTTFDTLVNPQQTYNHVRNSAGGDYIQSLNFLGGNSLIIGESHATDQFDVVMDIKISDDTDGLLVFGFGQNDAHSFQSGGFELVYNPTAAGITLNSSVPPLLLGSGQVVLRQKPGNYDDDAQSYVVGTPQALGAIGVAGGTLDTAATNRLAFRLGEDQVLTFSINGATATYFLGGAGENLSGHLTLRNALNELRVHTLYADFKGELNATTIGEMVPVSIPQYSTVDQGAYQFRPRSRVIQASLETSTASLTEYIPMLSIAQKVFSAISKIISTHNGITDDLNTLLR